MSSKKAGFTDGQLLRQKAEAKLKTNQKTSNPSIETDVKKLLHELQVHQIELEMQNEELRQANELTEAALRKFTLLYDFAPMGYFTLDQNGSILELNFTGAEILRDKRFCLINSNFSLFVSENSLPAFTAFLNRIFISSAKESCEIWLGDDDKTRCPVYMEGVATGDDQKCLLSVLDISAFKTTPNQRTQPLD